MRSVIAMTGNCARFGLMRNNTTNKEQQQPAMSLLVAGMIITAILPTLTALAGYFQAKSAAVNAAEAKMKAVETASEARKMATETSESVKLIHTAVNSERTAMQAELAKAREEIRALSILKAGEEEREKERTRTAGFSDAQVKQIIAALKAKPNE